MRESCEMKKCGSSVDFEMGTCLGEPGTALGSIGANADGGTWIMSEARKSVNKTTSIYPWDYLSLPFQTVHMRELFPIIASRSKDSWERDGDFGEKTCACNWRGQ